MWDGRTWKRRAPDNQYGVDIWFSCGVGKDAAGNNQYAILVKFSDRFGKTDTEPLGHKAQSKLAAIRQNRGNR
jgi:hypothetical protein